MHSKRCAALPCAVFAVFAGVLFAPPPAQADHGRLNLHLDIGIGAPLAGAGRPGSTGDSAAGGVAYIGGDLVLADPVAVELIVGIGGFARPLPTSSETGARYTMVGGGLRIRLLTDDAGYRGEDGGNLPSNLWVSAHIGYHNFDDAQFGIDAAIGYEISVVRPLQIGAFLRTAVMFGGDNAGADLILVGGISFSLEAIRIAGPADADDDGLSDEREAELGTNPNMPDTDRDGLDDRLEVETGTNPKERDTDGDGLLDGREDANRDGVLDDDETDPRRSDTDGGGMPDGSEVHAPSQDPRYPEDDDHDGDGVANHFDECEGTPDGQEVNAFGCPPQQQTINLEGIHFRSGSARILPDSEETLQQALRLLEREGTARFQVAGHTDSQGRPAANRALSQQRAEAVVRWLVRHGVDASRLEAAGYGADEPVADNDTAEGRAHNRRIEFRRL